MAAWEVKYRCEFADYLKLQWKIEFLEYLVSAPSVTSLMATDNPLKIEFLSNSDEFNDSIRPSKAIINVYSMTDFALLDFYSDQNFRIKCIIYAGANVYWTGFVITGEYSEPYDCPPYPVQITAVDGLNYLKNILYDDSGTYYNGRTLESQIIIDILSKIKIPEIVNDPIFIECINIYEVAMAVTSADSPFDQTKIDVDIFQDMYCYEVLVELLKKYNAVIRQVGGKIFIYRPTELIQATVYGRIFTAATTKTSTSFAPAQQISRAAGITNLKQFPGSPLMTKPPVKKITLNQDYGYKESWIDNWEAKLNTYNNIIQSYESWINKAGGAIYQLVNKFAGQELGFGMVSNSGVIGSRFYIKQIFGLYALNSSDVFIFSFDYLHYNKTAAVITVSVIIRIESNTSSHYLYITSDTEANWDASLNYVTFDSVALVGKSGWVSFSRQVMGIPASGSYTIYIYDTTGSTGDVGTLIKNVRFYSTSDEIISLATYGGIYIKPKKSWVTQNPMRPSPIVITTTLAPTLLIINKVATIVLREYIFTNALNGKELTLDYMLGDVADANITNVLEQFAGSMALVVPPSLPGIAGYFVSANADIYLAGGVIVTQGAGANDEDIIFTSNVAGTDFTGNTTITNVVADLNGSVVATQANRVAVPHKTTIELTGVSGTADMSCNGVTKLATFNYDLGTTAYDFCSSGNIADFAAAGVTLSVIGPILTFIHVTEHAIIEPIDADLNGIVTYYDEVTALPRIDTITLSGTTGSANILCDAVTRLATFDLITNTTTWNTRGGSENKPLLEIIGGEIGHQYSRPKQLIQMNMKETDAADTVLNIIGNVQDVLNSIYGAGGNLITGWTNVNYEIFTSSGVALSRLRNDVASGWCYSSTFNVVVGEKITVIFTLVKLAGVLPVIYLINDPWTLEDSSAIVEGVNEIELISTWAGVSRIVFWIDSDFGDVQMSDILVYRYPRKFVFNAGEFEAKMRMWSADLLEIIS